MSPYWRQLDTSELAAASGGDDTLREQAVWDEGYATAIARVIQWLHDQRPKPDICDCGGGDMNLDWAADQLEHGALD